MNLVAYTQFLNQKIAITDQFGFEVEESEINPILKPHQKACVKWGIRGGRRALFESFGLGKTMQQLEILRLIIKREGGDGLIVCPLGVRQEFIRDGKKLGITVRFIRSNAEKLNFGNYIFNSLDISEGVNYN